MTQHVATILLAAGRSRRMGRSKQLLPLGDLPVIRYCAETLLAAGQYDITVVLGPSGGEAEKAVSGLPVAIAWNNAPESDMAASARAGLRALSAIATGVLVCLADHPLVAPDTIRTLVRGHAENPEMIVIPAFQGKKGHPTLFPRPVIEELFTVPTLRHIVRKDPARVHVEAVPDKGTIMDMDTPEDYLRILATLESSGKIKEGQPQAG